MSRTAILFASDLHGSNSCFIKLIAAAKETRPSCVAIGGDLSGKELVLIQRNVGGYRALIEGREEAIANDGSLRDFRKHLGDHGYYTHVLDGDTRASELSDDERATVKRSSIRKRLQQWSAFAEAELSSFGIPVFLVPGNDDPLDIGDDISVSPAIVNVEDKFVALDEYRVGGLGYSNVTPWHCPRELSESEIKERLARIFREVEDPRRVVLLCHVPPYASGLDIAPELVQDEGGELELVAGGESFVGSTALREVVEEQQPLLVLSGHCHDSPGFQHLGSTLCVNAGSSYGRGVLRMAWLVLDGGQVCGYQMLMR
ncbi:MAG: metallophosphoesterase family protein [Vicinamibacteria bacterium]